MKIWKRLTAVIVLVLFASSATARIWKTADRKTFSGDYVNVVGDNVQFKTNSGTKLVPYAAMSRADKAIIRTKLTAAGRESEISRLDSLQAPSTSAPVTTPPPQSTTPSVGSGSASPSSTQPASGQSRTFTDIGGRQLQGEFVSASPVTVTIRVNGIARTFPIAGFSPQDQAWIRSQSGSVAGGNQTTTTPSTTTPGTTFVPSGASGNMTPSAPGFPGGFSPGTPGISGGHGGSSAPTTSFGPPPGFGPPATGPSGGHASTTPGNAAFPGTSTTPGMQSTFPQTQSITPGGAGSPGQATGFGAGAGHGAGSAAGSFGNEFGGGPGYGGPPDMGEPEFAFPDPPEPPDIHVPDISIPTIEWVYTCDNCGAEFSESDGIKEGDPCPKCSGGGGGASFSARGIVKVVIGLVALAVSGIGFVIRKMASS